MANNLWWWLKSFNMYMSTNDKYSFGFSGWKTFDTRGTPIYDEFEMNIWRIRKEAGFDEPMPEPIRFETPINGQILFSGPINIPNPKFRATITNWMESDGEESD